MTAPRIRILSVDDNRLVGDALATHFDRAGGFEWLGQLPDAGGLCDAALRLRPDVVLLDVDMPGKDALAALGELARECPDVRVVVLSGYVGRDLVERALETGAWGYLTKNEDPDTIVASIARVIAGEVVIGPDAQASLGR